MTTPPPTDGGPAFPSTRFMERNSDGDYLAKEQARGMTLRDYFAAHVIQGLLANPAVVAHNHSVGWSLVNCDAQALAIYVDNVVDAMLAEREKRR